MQKARVEVAKAPRWAANDGRRGRVEAAPEGIERDDELRATVVANDRLARAAASYPAAVRGTAAPCRAPASPALRRCGRCRPGRRDPEVSGAVCVRLPALATVPKERR